MANELITREDLVRGKQNFDAFDKYLEGGAKENVRLPSGKSIKTRAGIEEELKAKFPEDTVGLRKHGYTAGSVPLSEQAYRAVFGVATPVLSLEQTSPKLDLNDLEPGTRYRINGLSSFENAPSREFGSEFYIIETIAMPNSAVVQIAQGYTVNIRLQRIRSFRGDWSRWAPLTSTPMTYNLTTADPANVVVSQSGELQRTTSSRVFKDRIENLDVDEYRVLLRSIQPVSYHSKHTSDDPDRIWYSFIAEDLMKVDPHLVQLSQVEFFEDKDEEGEVFVNSRELPDGEYAPAGLNLNGIVTMLTRINQYMLDDIEALEAEKTQLKSRMTKLENRLESLEKQLAAE